MIIYRGNRESITVDVLATVCVKSDRLLAPVVCMEGNWAYKWGLLPVVDRGVTPH